jgi:hypothetical protein
MRKALFCGNIIVTKSKEEKPGCNLAEGHKKVHAREKAVLPLMMMMMMMHY